MVEVAPGFGNAIIHAILPRRCSISRKAPISGGRKIRTFQGHQMTAGGSTEAQIVAANVDIVFIMSALDSDFSPRRLERYLAVVKSTGCNPIILLNKVDLCSDVSGKVSSARAVAAGVPIHALCALEDEAFEELEGYLTKGRTAALIGSSGVGKSTLVNSLLGETRQAVGSVRAYDGKGRHVTTHRELVIVPSGGLVIDNPGLREIQIWGDESDLKSAFADIEALADNCRFRDCRHDTEPGCAVREALEEGSLDIERYRSYSKLEAELAYLSFRKDQRARLIDKAKVRRMKTGGH
jgi:ribosome biogenesis GTPase